MAQPPPSHHHQHQQYYPAPAYQAPPQYGYPRPPHPPHPAPNFHVSSKGMWSSKLTLRLLSMIFCIVIISLAAVVLSDLNPISLLYRRDIWDDSFYIWGYPGPILFLGPPVGAAFLWSLIESICICARGGHRGIHPGACVAIDLLLWLGFVGGAVCVALYLPWIFVASSFYSYPMTTFVFGIIEAGIHFALFVIACCETSARNRSPPVTYAHNVHYNSGTVPPTAGPSVAMPYQSKEQVSPVVQPAVARKPLSSFGAPRSPTWDQQSGVRTDGMPTPEPTAQPFPSLPTSELPASFHPNNNNGKNNGY